VRFSEDEHPDVVLERLLLNEPRWQPHPLATRPDHPEASGVSATHETRADWQARHDAWAKAVEREKERKAAQA
jgi:hypothetical protein